MRPFSSGSQFMDWESANCERCKNAAFYVDGRMPDHCDIQVAIAEAAMGDGHITDEIADRMTRSDGRYNWPCGEADWTEEWKVEWLAMNGEEVPE